LPIEHQFVIHIKITKRNRDHPHRKSKSYFLQSAPLHRTGERVPAHPEKGNFQNIFCTSDKRPLPAFF
jgi:hypothetical protein